MENVYISDYDCEALARALLPSIQEFYSKDENIRAFEGWKASQPDDK